MKVVDVLGTPYKLVPQKQEDGTDLTTGDEGACSVEKATIFYWDELSEVRRGPVNRHELGHAVSFETGFRWYLHQRLGPDLAEEVEEALMQIFLPSYLLTLKGSGL